MNSGKKLRKNTFSSLVLQITTIVSGFILPRLIIINFGSDINGLVNSITQFLAVISFLELGIGAVVQSALYKPLAENNKILISQIITSAEKFFRKIAYILSVYVIILIIIYPIIVNNHYDWFFTASLIFAISVSSFARYYFGIVDKLLLNADQKGYIQCDSQTIAILIATAASVVLIKLGASIQIVKLTISIIYLIRPFIVRQYVNKKYNINRKEEYSCEPINQKWNGISQHIATVVLDNTDTIVLTVMSTLSNVSIYSVYHLVVYGVKNLFMSMTNGIQALLGEIWAKSGKNLERVFAWTEWIFHTSTILIFGCTGVLIVPFIQVYTNGANDANYVQPLFASLIVSAHACHCLRMPYHMMIRAAGHYKETQNSYLIAAAINLVITVATVKVFGLVGVAIGTLIAMVFQTCWLTIYNYRYLIKRPFKVLLKQIVVDLITIIIAVLLTSWISLKEITYVNWIIEAFFVLMGWIVISFVINIIFYKEKLVDLLKLIKRKIKW